MELAAIGSKNRKMRKVRSAAWKGAAELLECRRFLSGSPTPNMDAATAAFIENRGQWSDAGIRYALPSPGGNIYITDDGPVFHLLQGQTDGTKLSEAFFVTFDGSNHVRPTGVIRNEAVNNFFFGDQSNWRTNVPGYDKIAYRGLYEGVDLFAWGRHNSLKYEFHVAPGADWEQVQISYDGIESLSIDSQGRLHIQATNGSFIDDAPWVYQVINGQRVTIQSSFRLVDNDTYTFELHGAYDPRYELVLDPAIDWSTYLGAPEDDQINAVTTSTGGGQVVAYVTGFTENGVIFPSLSGVRVGSPPILPYIQGSANDVFVTKMSSNGQQVIWNTFLGGADNEDDEGRAITIDNNGRVIVVGTTESTDFVTTVGAFDRQYGTPAGNGTNGDVDSFVAQFSPNGVLQYSTYFGTDNDDIANAVDVDSNGFVYVAGRTTAATDSGFVTIMPDLISTTTRSGGADGFISKWDFGPLALSDVVWNRYYGGSGNNDDVNGMEVTAAGNIFVVGTTNANNNNNANPPINPGAFTAGIATTAAYQQAYGGGNTDAYVARFDTNGVLQWGTYLGGSGADTGRAIAVRNDGLQLAVTGQTGSTDFNIFPDLPAPPTSPILLAGTPQPTIRQGTNDAYVAKFDTAGIIIMSAYLGGVGNGDVGVAIEYSGRSILIAGDTNSANFPFFDFNNVQNILLLGGIDSFVVKLTPASTDDLDAVLNVEYAFPFGGSGDDEASGLAIDAAGAVWLVGSTDSPSASDFNLEGIYRSEGLALPPLIGVRPGNDDGFIAHFSESAGAAPPASPSNTRALALSMTSIQVTWSDNSNNETGFLIRRKLGAGGTYQTVGAVSANVKVFNDTNLLPSTTYYYIVYSFNLTGNSTASNAAFATTRTSTVGVPLGLTATAISANRIDLAWTDNADNESSVEVYRSESGGAFTQIATLNANTVSYQDTTGLSAGTLYTYRIRAINQFRASGFSNDASATTLGGAFMIPPSNLVGLPISVTAVRLTWTDNSDNEQGFSVERSVFGTGIFNVIGSTGAGETVFIDPNIAPGTIYTYRVRAFNGLGFSAYSNTSNSDPANALATPTVVEARATSSSTILVTWADKAQIETGYVIERAIGQPSDFNAIVTTGPNTTSFNDTNLLPRTRYFYRVRATDGNVTSAESPVASTTTLATGFFPPATPTVIRGRALSFTSIQVTWQDNSSTETAFSIERASVLEGPYATIGTVAANVRSFTDIGLMDGTVYYYRVTARQGTTLSLPSSVLKIRTIVRPRVVINPVDVVGAEGGNTLTFNIRRKDNLTGNLTVFYSLTGTATNTKDYNTMSGSVTIPNGVATANVVITPKEDTLVEGTETVIVTLLGSAAYKVSPSLKTAQGTIADNDGVGGARVSSVSGLFSSQPVSSWDVFTGTKRDPLLLL